MSQSTKMNTALKKYVIKPLLDNGFTGDFPHYRKIYDNRIELFTIQKNKWGNSFTIEISTVYPNRTGEDTNLTNEQANFDEVCVWEANKRYRLPGMFDGWFYYTDVYVKRMPRLGKVYLDVSEKKKQEIHPEKAGYKQIQVADDSIYERICCEVNNQMKKAYKWWKKMA